jgi:hypothetical protein
MDLHVELLGAEIVVTRPGTAFMTAYRKRPDGPTLKLTRSWVDPHTTSPAVSEFPRLSGGGQQGPRAGVDCVSIASV